MSKITRQDSNGVKPLLATGELGYDNYPAGGDAGRVYVGTGTQNIAQAKKAEVIAVDGKVNTHTARTDNPHSVTKAQVGLGNVSNVDTTNASNITSGTLSADRLAVSGAVAGTYKSVVVDDKGRVLSGTNPTTLSGYGITDADTSAQVTTKINNAVASLVDSSPTTLDTLNELAAALGDDPNFATSTATAIGLKADTSYVNTQLALKAPLESPVFTGSPMAPTQVYTDNSDKVVTTAWSKLGLSYSLGHNGYIKFPNWLSGITIQWGVTSLISASNIVVTTPISFASASYTTYATARTGSSFGNILSTDAGSLSQFTIYANATITATVAWLRIGK